MEELSPQRDGARHVSLSDLCTGFLMIGLLGFGGLGASAHYIIVERRRWLTPKEFVELFAICAILPGGNFMNATIMLGAKHHGVMGSVLAMSSLLFMPLLILIAVVVTYDHFSYLPDVRAAIGGAASAAAGLIVATATKLGRGVVWKAAPIFFAVATFVAISYFRAPLWLVVALMAPPSVLAALWQGRRP